MTKLSSEILRAVRRSDASSQEIAAVIDSLGKKPAPLVQLVGDIVDAVAPKRRGRPPKYQTRHMTAEV